MEMGIGSLKKPKILACCLLAFYLFGGAPTVRPMETSRLRRPDAERQSRARGLRASITHGAELYRDGQYEQASQIFQSVYTQAKSYSMQAEAARALGGVGGSQFALHQYRAALRSFLESQQL